MKYPALFLLGAILATGDPAYAAASPQADSPERRSNLEETEWQSAEVTSEQITPSKDWTDMQKLEWDVGTLAGAAQLCGLLAKGRKIQVFMKKSPYFRKGLNKMSSFDGYRGCGRLGKIIDDFVKVKDKWEYYFNSTYTNQPNSIKPPKKHCRSEFDTRDRDIVLCVELGKGQ